MPRCISDPRDIEGGNEPVCELWPDRLAATGYHRWALHIAKGISKFKDTGRLEIKIRQLSALAGIEHPQRNDANVTWAGHHRCRPHENPPMPPSCFLRMRVHEEQHVGTNRGRFWIAARPNR